LKFGGILFLDKCHNLVFVKLNDLFYKKTETSFVITLWTEILRRKNVRAVDEALLDLQVCKICASHK